MILRCEADESDSKATEKVIDGYVLGAGSTGVDGLLTEKRVLEAQIVHQSAADGPGIGKGDLAIVYGFRLIENGLRGINWQDEVLLVNEKSCAKLMASHGVVRVYNRVMFALENRTENGDVADGNVGLGYPGDDRTIDANLSSIVRHCYGKISQ